METGPCLPLPLIATGKETEKCSSNQIPELMHVRLSRACESIVPAMPYEWDAWLEEHIRQYRFYAAYGYPFAAQEPAA